MLTIEVLNDSMQRAHQVSVVKFKILYSFLEIALNHFLNQYKVLIARGISTVDKFATKLWEVRAINEDVIFLHEKICD